jgi:hypothetical protein
MPRQKAKGKRQKAKVRMAKPTFLLPFALSLLPFAFFFYSCFPRTQYSSNNPFMASPMPS